MHLYRVVVHLVEQYTIRQTAHCLINIQVVHTSSSDEFHVEAMFDTPELLPLTHNQRHRGKEALELSRGLCTSAADV